MKKIYLFAISICITTSSIAQCWLTTSSIAYHTLALRQDSTLWSWGKNEKGQVGNNSLIDCTYPTPLALGSKWKTISAGFSHSLAIKNDGTLWAWGDNFYYMLGDGTQIDKIQPIQIGTSNDWKIVKASYVSSFAIKNDGTLWSWGYNINGELGDSTFSPINTPKKVGLDNDWKSISQDANHNLALKNNGTLWAWGKNNYGQLGQGNNTDYNYPKQIGTQNNWKEIATMNGVSIAIKSDGTLWTWGENLYGTLGNGLTNGPNVLSPTQIGTETNWNKILCASGSIICNKINGTNYGWGPNFSGELGIGNTTLYSSPILINNTNWISLAMGKSHTNGVNNLNELYSWGDNSFGQLGDSTITNNVNAIKIKTNICYPLQTNNFIKENSIALIYPNPCSNLIQLNKSVTLLKVIDLVGKEYNLPKLGNNVFDISLLKNGIYIIQMNNGSKVIIEKIIKE
jgi:alpha-tubulin suppressor-like RCC1 family protein